MKDKPYPDNPWRVGLFWSSSTPNRRVRVLAETQAEIDRFEQRRDFIKWLTPLISDGVE